MKPFDYDTFEAFGEAGLSRSDALERIHEHYEKEAGKSVRASYLEGASLGETLRWGLTVCTVVGFLGGGVTLLCKRDLAAHERYMNACRTGDAVICYEGVQEQRDEAEKVGPGNHNARARAFALCLAYRLKTGQELPSK